MDTLTTYASYSEGFKSGGFDMRGDVVLTPDTVNGYDAETVTTYELGLKGSAFDGRASFNAAVFYSDYSDQQITRQEPTVTGVDRELRRQRRRFDDPGRGARGRDFSSPTSCR